jgi:hypothetical protein
MCDRALAEARLNAEIEAYGFRISPRQSLKDRLGRFLELKCQVAIRHSMERRIRERGWPVNTRLPLRKMMAQYMVYQEREEGRETPMEEIHETVEEFIMEEKNDYAKPILGKLYGKQL